jgi:outer membrane lipase/esterase
MEFRRGLWMGALAAALLVACGGGGEGYVPGSTPTAGAPTTLGTFSAVVSFGDSLSDAGAYSPATSLSGNGQAPYFGGRFTNNGASSTVWVENIAASLRIALTPHEVGFAGQSVKCPAAAGGAVLAASCTAYGQGGSRVTDPNGIGKAGGALTVPVKTQIANHLARFASFKNSDLIIVLVGANDAFTHFGTFAATAATVQATAAAGRITADQANNQLLEAQLAAQGEMKKAALELAGYVRTEILAKGGRYVAVATLPDIVDSPFGATLPASAQPVLTSLSEIFNLWLREGLGGQPVQIIDTFPLFKEVKANPARYGFVNNTVPACDGAKINAITRGAVTDGSSLFCNSTPGVPFNGIRAGANVNTWQFADGVHPTTRPSATRCSSCCAPTAGSEQETRFMNSKNMLRPAVLAAAAVLAAGLAQAQGLTVKAGVTRYDTHAKTSGVRGIGIPPGADVEVGDATTALFVFEWGFDQNSSIELALGIPPTVKAKGAGSVAFLGDDVLSAKNYAPTLLFNYTFGPAGQTLRPYVGAGINYTRFKNIKSRLAPDVSMSDSVGPVVQVGVLYSFNKNMGLYASLARVDVKTEVVAVASTVIQTSIDFKPRTYSLGAWYRF